MMNKKTLTIVMVASVQAPTHPPFGHSLRKIGKKTLLKNIHYDRIAPRIEHIYIRSTVVGYITPTFSGDKITLRPDSSMLKVQ